MYSNFQFSYWDSWRCCINNRPLHFTFNSLIEIPRNSASGFPQSFLLCFQFSYWDSVDVYESKVKGGITLSILLLRFPNCPLHLSILIHLHFQFSYWDSKMTQCAPGTGYFTVFQFSYWDSRWIILSIAGHQYSNSFNSLIEIQEEIIETLYIALNVLTFNSLIEIPIWIHFPRNLHVFIHPLSILLLRFCISNSCSKNNWETTLSILLLRFIVFHTHFQSPQLSMTFNSLIEIHEDEIGVKPWRFP